MKVNVKLLKKVRKLIQEEPRRMRMSSWGRKTDGSDISNPPPCGTVACLAGWTVLAAVPKSRWKKLFAAGYLRVRMKHVPYHENYSNPIPFRAAKLLGMDVSQCPFDQTRWGAAEVLAWIDKEIAKAEAK